MKATRKFLRPRWQKVLSDLWSNRVRSLLVIISIAVGLFAVGLIATTYAVIKVDMVSSYAAANPANIQLTFAGFNDGYVDTAKNVPGVSAAEGVRNFSVQIKSGENEYIRSSFRAVQNFDKMDINRVRLLEGTWPPKDKEIVFDRHKLEEIHAGVGDMVVIKLPDGKEREMRLAGVVQDQTIGSSFGGGGYFVAQLQGYVTFDTLEWLEQPKIMNQLYATVAEDVNNPAHIQQIAGEITHKFEQNNILAINTVIRRRNEHPNMIYVDAMTAILYTLGFLVVFLSGFLIVNTLSALLNQQTEQIGVMKSVGGRRKDIISIFMALIVAYSLLALAIAAPLASPAAFAILKVISEQINFNLGPFRQEPSALLLQVIIALLIPPAAGFVPILRGSFLTIQEAFSGNNGSQEKPSEWINTITSSLHLPRPLLISLRNTFRRKGRLALTLLTLTLGGAIFIATFNVQTSTQSYIVSLTKYFVSDVNLTLDRPYLIEQIEPILLSIPGVGQVESWSGAQAEFLNKDDKPGESFRMVAPPPDSPLIHPVMLRGRWIQPGDTNAIVINEMFLSKFPGIQPGDTLRLRVNGEKTEWVVVGIFQFAGKSGGYIAYADFNYVSNLTHMTGKAANFQIVSDRPLKTLEEQNELSAQIEARLETEGIRTSEVRAGLSLLGSASNGLNVMIGFLLIMAILAALVGSIGLAGTLSMNVMERTREIAVMRSIGASNHSIMQLVIVEGMLIGVISWVLSCLLAIPISNLMWSVVGNALFDSASRLTWNAVGYVLWLFLVLVLTVLASVTPARSAARLTIREALAYE